MLISALLLRMAENTLDYVSFIFGDAGLDNSGEELEDIDYASFYRTLQQEDIDGGWLHDFSI